MGLSIRAAGDRSSGKAREKNGEQRQKRSRL